MHRSTASSNPTPKMPWSSTSAPARRATGRTCSTSRSSPARAADVVGVAERLPFRDACADGLILMAVLEHVADEQATLAEAARVLRPGGRLLVDVPFLQGYHASPADYRRYTEQGLRAELERHGFEVEGSGVAVGPGSAAAWTISEYLALLLSGRSARIYRLARLATAWLALPLKYTDAWLERHPMAYVIPSAVWAIGRKPQEDAGGDLLVERRDLGGHALAREAAVRLLAGGRAEPDRASQRAGDRGRERPSRRRARRAARCGRGRSARGRRRRGSRRRARRRPSPRAPSAGSPRSRSRARRRRPRRAGQGRLDGCRPGARGRAARARRQAARAPDGAARRRRA